MKKWQIKTLEELCDEIFAGGDVPKNDFSKIKTEDFKIPIYANGEKNLGLYGYTNISKVNPPALTISGRGTIGFSVVRKVPFFPIVRLLVLIPNSETDIQFLKYSIDNCNIKHTGSSIPQLTVPTVKGIKIPIPNLETQQAIVSKIEELFSELDKGIEDLKTAQQQLKTYRQSVLKWAFEGKLTNENVKEGKLPKGWGIMMLGELGKWKGGGTPSKQNKSFWENGTNLWVSSKDMKFKNINDSIDKITDEAIVKSSAKMISKGAILFVMRSGILRHTLPVAIAGKNLTVNQDLQSVEPFEFIDTEYFYWFIVGHNQKIRQECSKDGTTVESIDTTSLKKYPIPIAPIKEQHRIVQEIESRLSVADKMEESIAQSLQQAEALRQSILKKAFSGELM